MNSHWGLHFECADIQEFVQCSLVTTMEELEKESMDLVALDTEEIACPDAVEAVQKGKKDLPGAISFFHKRVATR